MSCGEGRQLTGGWRFKKHSILCTIGVDLSFNANCVICVTVAIKVLDTHHCRLLLVQGGLEIPIQVMVTIEYSTKNNDAMDELMVTD